MKTSALECFRQKLASKTSILPTRFKIEITKYLRNGTTHDEHRTCKRKSRLCLPHLKKNRKHKFKKKKLHSTL